MPSGGRVEVLVRVAAGLLAAMAAGPAAAAPAAGGTPGDVVRIGVMNDGSGPYADNCGAGSVAAVRLAVEDHGGTVAGRKIEVVVADDQNNPDVGLATARRWLDQDGVDAIVGCSASSIALSVSDLMAQRGKPYMLAGTGTAALTDDRCSPMNTQWVQDVYALPKATVKALLGQGLDTWFFITVDYSFGKDWQAQTAKFVEQGGGKVLGSVLHPLNAADFSSYLLQAQASKAKVVALANSGTDLANAMKQAAEFGMAEGGQRMAPLGLYINATNGIGLDALQGTVLTTIFYWDRTDGTRAFAKRFQAAFGGRIPNELQAISYSAANHYLDAVQATGTTDGPAVMKAMKAMPVDDAIVQGAKIREDGQVMLPVYAARVKSPKESKGPNDDYVITATIPPEQVFRPASESRCKLLQPR